MFEYEIDRGKRKNVYILIKSGKVLVRVPKRFPEYKINSILKEKEKWIIKKLEEYKDAKREEHYFKEGEKFYILGKEYILRINNTNKKRAFIDIENENLCIYKNQDLDLKEKQIEAMLEKFYLKLAKIEIPKILEVVTKEVELYPSSYSIKNMKRAFGNCKSKKEIHLNKNLVKYSKKAIYYVCLHEICHLKYMNHSKDFWKMVSKYMPDYKNAEKELKNEIV